MDTTSSGNLVDSNEDLSPVARGIFVFIGSVEVISGLLGNSLLIAAAFYDSTRRSGFHSALLGNMAAVDVLSMCYWMPIVVLNIAGGQDSGGTVGICASDGIIVSFCATVSILSLMSISFDRYLHVCHAHIYSRLYSKKAAALWCLTLLIVGLALALCGNEFGNFQYDDRLHACLWRTDDLLLFPGTLAALCSVSPCLIGYWSLAVYLYWTDKGLKVREKVVLSQWLQNSRPRLHTETPEEEEEEEEEEVEEEKIDDDDDKKGDAEEEGDANIPENRLRHADELNREDPEESPYDEEKDDDASNRSSNSPATQRIASGDDVFIHRPNGNERFGEQNSNERCSDRASSPAVVAIQMAPAPLSPVPSILKERHEKERAKEIAFQVSLCVIVSMVFISHFPYAIFIVVDMTSGPVSSHVAISFTFLLFLSRAGNWVVYGLMNRSFKRGVFKKLRIRIGKTCRHVIPTFPKDLYEDVPFKWGTH